MLSIVPGAHSAPPLLFLQNSMITKPASHPMLWLCLPLHSRLSLLPSLHIPDSPTVCSLTSEAGAPHSLFLLLSMLFLDSKHCPHASSSHPTSLCCSLLAEPKRGPLSGQKWGLQSPRLTSHSRVQRVGLELRGSNNWNWGRLPTSSQPPGGQEWT